MSEKTPQTKRKLSRRDFLVLTGVAGGLYFGVTLGVLPYARLKLAEFLDSAGGPPSSVDAVPLAWFEIGTDNSFKIYIPKVEMGQGIHTTLAQAAAEELDVPWDALSVLNVGTGKGLDDPVGTSASNSTSSLFSVIRQAGATVREMLRLEGAKLLGLGAQDVVAENGFVTARQDAGKNVSYGEIVQAVSEWQIPEELPALKKTSDFRYIGKAMPRVDLRDKVLGKTEYGFDVRLPGMLYGAVAMPAKIGATLKRAAAGGAEGQPGVVKVVLEEDFAGVVAERRDQAWNALGALDLEWNEEKVWQQADIDAIIQFGNGRGVTVQEEGNAGSKLSGADVFESEYFSPIAYHAHMEPQSAAADVRADGATVWASTQAAVGVRRAVARAIEMDEELVVVIPTFLGGGFGQKVNSVPAVQAARLSKAVGRPVHLGYRRAEDFQNGFVRPPSRSHLRAVVRENGLIDAIEHKQVSGQVAFPFLPVFVSAVMGADFGAYRGAQIRYGIPNKRVEAWMADLPMKTGWWRGLGLLPNLFAIESFIDELAAKIGMDPILIRLVNLPLNEMGERMKKVLEAVRKKSDWDLPAPAGRARGVALSYDVNTIVACVAEVSVENGKIRVHKLTGAVDAGFFVNPDGATAQMEGGFNMALSSALLEETTVRDGALTPINFGAYQFLNNAAAPEIVVELINSGDKPFGMGEPPLGPVAPAVANAVFALTGQRLRNLPLKLG